MYTESPATRQGMDEHLDVDAALKPNGNLETKCIATIYYVEHQNGSDPKEDSTVSMHSALHSPSNYVAAAPEGEAMDILVPPIQGIEAEMKGESQAVAVAVVVERDAMIGSDCDLGQIAVEQVGLEGHSLVHSSGDGEQL